MIETMEATKRQKKDIWLLGKFVEVYCSGKHDKTRQTAVELPPHRISCRLCPECSSFLHYAIARRLSCPLEAEKPTCKHCKIHCYASEQRTMVRQIMAYSGRKLMLRGRLDYLWHYFF